jgi:broad specificity phosphatase PhoE
VALVYLVQHGDKEPLPGDPGLTELGQRQATRTGRWLRGQAVRALYTSPLLRARQTAARIAAVTGLPVQADDRLRERLNWHAPEPFEAFLAVWARTDRDRDFVPAHGDSSRQAGMRLQAFLAGLPATARPAAAVTHGGVTADLLRNLLGDSALPPRVLAANIPPCAVTTIDGLHVLTIASTSHLA